MMFRATGAGAALVLGLLLSQPAAAQLCEGASCPPAAKSKPLDIMQFMREQAASTRAAERRPQANTHARRSASPVTARSKAQPQPAQAKANTTQAKTTQSTTTQARPTELPIEASKSFASHPAQDISAVESDEINAIDRAGDTAGAAERVQLVDATEFNAIDRKAYEALLRAAAERREADAQTRSEPQSSAPRSSGSWLQWIWSAVAGTFAALATAMHQLIG
jgi:hypothetical protein